MTYVRAKYRGKPAMTADEVRSYIVEMDAGCKSKAARVRMAENAIAIGHITEEGKDVWRDYLKTQRG